MIIYMIMHSMILLPQKHPRVITVPLLFFISIFLSLLLIKVHSNNHHQWDKNNDDNNNNNNKNNNDNWCKVNCASLDTCSNKFKDDYVDLQFKILPVSKSKHNNSMNNDYYLGTIGDDLVYESYFGDTVARQTFETQFVLDLAQAMSVSVCRIHVLDVTALAEPANNISASLVVTFRLYPVNISDVQNLTQTIQDYPNSVLYQGKVTHFVDPSVGLVVHQWDLSLRLLIHIDMIIGDDSKGHNDGRMYLNEGSKRWCEDEDNIGALNVTYCQFEQYFRDDLVMTLDLIENRSMVQVLMIEPSGMDSVIIKFRFLPRTVTNSAIWVQSMITDLLNQILDYESNLYQGNVTVRTDPTWGISGKERYTRKSSPFMPYSILPAMKNEYERCKATQRCSRGTVIYNQSNSSSDYFSQIFADGTRNTIPLFADFEDWRQGTGGWNAQGKDQVHRLFPRGSHWSPFDFESKGPKVPVYGVSSNNGLVLNNDLLCDQEYQQVNAINKIKSQINWIQQNKETALLDAWRRSRFDVKHDMNNILQRYVEQSAAEEAKLLALSGSQCRKIDCTLIFNTSSLELGGAINVTGDIVMYDDGTEVAVWVFDSINLDRNVTVTLTGQRAHVIISRSSLFIDTPFKVAAGTLGGFPGGFSVFRKKKDRLISVCENVSAFPADSACFQRGTCCVGDVYLAELRNGIISNNVNGPGSGSVRVYQKTIETVVPHQKEIQSIVVDGDAEGTISGSFRLHFRNYSTALLPFDVTPSDLKQSIEQSLNIMPSMLALENRSNYMPGVGKVLVSRGSIGTSGGFAWRLTFESAIGNVETISATSSLAGKDARIDIMTIQNGTSIEGSFQLHFLNESTRMLQHDISAYDLELALLEDISVLESVFVIRTDPLDKCSDGLCSNKPSQGGGYIWTLVLATKIGNLSPASPTSTEFDLEGVFETLTSTSFLTGCIENACPSIIITDGHERSHVSSMRSLVAKKPFSFSYGGSGAGYGGNGGSGYGSNQPGLSYGDKFISKLLGGSGGSLGFTQPFEANTFDILDGRGGSGGGAIGFFAVNDIVIGPNCQITANGENGHDGMLTAGGGGSGGSILLSAGGTVKVDGYISAKGGKGGVASNSKGKIGVEDGNGGGGSGGRIAIYAETTVNLSTQGCYEGVIGGKCENIPGFKRNRNCTGHRGTFYVSPKMMADVYVDNNIGAAGTNSSLFLRSKPHIQKDSIVPRIYGPTYNLGDLMRPGKLSFFVRLAEMKNKLNDRLSFHSRGLSIEFLQSYRNSNNTLISQTDSKQTVIGVFVGNDITHGSGYVGRDDAYSRNLRTLQPILKETSNEKWYKIDVRLNWREHVYDILVDDELLGHNLTFDGDGINYVHVSNSHSNVAAWIDEIYIGDDNTMEFRCPMTDSSRIHMNRPMQTGWTYADVGEKSSFYSMQRHESHLSQREKYHTPDSEYLIPYDGSPHRSFHSDIKFRYDNGYRMHINGTFTFDSLTKVIDDKGHVKHMWYGEHNNTRQSSEGYKNDRTLMGGIAACSSYDMISWKYEGIVLHNINITDMVKGRDGPFHVERPRVLFDKNASKYVMWMVLNNDKNDLNMAGVAVSDYPSGPFSFVRSLYPDGNETQDQSIFFEGTEDQNHFEAEPRAFLIRTYYATVEYILPAAIMQPIWESVKNPDGSTNFGMTYHRAFYEAGYDNINDIFLQRWRKEDTPWKVICIDKLSEVEREVHYGEEFLNKDGEVCDRPREYKKIIGQGSPLSGPVRSRYLDPDAPANNIWKPSSVPTVKAQTWSANVRDSECGFHSYESSEGSAISKTGVSNKIRCSDRASSIVDNPIHSTPPDKLIGPEHVAESRRAKFTAISQLTDDYLDTTGYTHVVEGEIEGDADLGNIIWASFGKEGTSSMLIDNLDWLSKFNLLDKLSESSIKETQSALRQRSTGFKTADDWNTRFHQYEEHYNDRAEYSVGCIADGKCPVNFKDQIKL